MALEVKNLLASAGDIRDGWFDPWVGKEMANPLQYSYLENPMDKGAQWAPVHRVAKSRT